MEQNKEVNEVAKVAENIKPNLTGMNAAKAYKILYDIKLDGKTLFDIALKPESEGMLGLMTPEERVEYMEMQDPEKQADAAFKKKAEKRQRELTAKYTLQLVKMSGDYDFEVSKALKLNPEKTFELAELYSGTKTDDFMEAVGQAKSYIIFLKEL